MRLRMLNRVVTKLYDDALRPLDLKVSQIEHFGGGGEDGHGPPRRSLRAAASRCVHVESQCGKDESSRLAGSRSPTRTVARSRFDLHNRVASC